MNTVYIPKQPHTRRIPKHIMRSMFASICVSINMHTLGQCVVNGVFDWNRMTVRIHAGFPLLNSAIRLTVCESADVPAHLNDLQPVCEC